MQRDISYFGGMMTDAVVKNAVCPHCFVKKRQRQCNIRQWKPTESFLRRLHEEDVRRISELWEELDEEFGRSTRFFVIAPHNVCKRDFSTLIFLWNQKAVKGFVCEFCESWERKSFVHLKALRKDSLCRAASRDATIRLASSQLFGLWP